MKCAPCVIAITREGLVKDQKLVPDAVTQINGTLVCARHAVETADDPRGGNRDAVLRVTTPRIGQRQPPVR